MGRVEFSGVEGKQFALARTDVILGDDQRVAHLPCTLASEGIHRGGVIHRVQVFGNRRSPLVLTRVDALAELLHAAHLSVCTGQRQVDVRGFGCGHVPAPCGLPPAAFCRGEQQSFPEVGGRELVQRCVEWGGFDGDGRGAHLAIPGPLAELDQPFGHGVIGHSDQIGHELLMRLRIPPHRKQGTAMGQNGLGTGVRLGYGLEIGDRIQVIAALAVRFCQAVIEAQKLLRGETALVGVALQSLLVADDGLAVAFRIKVRIALTHQHLLLHGGF